MKSNIIFFLTLILFTILSSLHAQKIEKTIINSQDLLKALAYDESGHKVKIYEWKLADRNVTSIIWDEDGNGWSPKGFERRGEVYLTNQEKIIDNKKEEKKWKIFFLGDKYKITKVELTPNTTAQKNAKIIVDKDFIQEKIICEDSNRSKITFYAIKFPKKKRFWMEENTTADQYTISYDKKPICKTAKKRDLKITSTKNMNINQTQIQENITPIKKYSININVEPLDAKIDITNIKDFFHQGIRLKKGIYYFEISKEGYQTYKNSFELTKDSSFDVVLKKNIIVETKQIDAITIPQTLPYVDADSINDRIYEILQDLENKTNYILENRKSMNYAQFMDYHDKVVELENVVMSYQGDDKIWLADKYGVLSWYQNLTTEYKKAIAYAKKGLELAPSLNWINKMLAHAYLFSGYENRAKQIYIENMYTTIDNGRITWEDSVLKDFDFFERFDIHYDMYDEIYQIFNTQ
jgi:hypothetical protein